MATLSHANSGRMYSWWWDSHISPKNSRWLQENLTDMDAKVKSMIRLIEEDADSFARRAEMYYKKRPELMKLVEEFYRAYRALAERYDHATGVIRQAHRTMAEAFPNQVPFVLDDSPASAASGEPRTPDMSTPVRSFFELEDLQKDVVLSGVRPNGEGRVRKGLKFHEALENAESVQTNDKQYYQNQPKTEPEQVGDSREILILKEANDKVEAEKEAGIAQYQQSLEKLSMLESEITRAQEDSRGLSERATQAEGEVQTLKAALAKLEAEKEANFEKYHKCLDKISNLENNISHAQEDTEEMKQRASEAKTEVLLLKDELEKVAAEKDAALDQYMSSLERISNLEHKLQCTEEDARKLKERAENAENEVCNLKQGISTLTDEKGAAELQYQQCLETISGLEHNLSSAREEAQRLRAEIENGVANLKGAEERCLMLERSNQSLHSELEALMLKMGSQSQELTEKQKEMGRLWTCIQEERLRFIEAETAFQTLQHLHAQAQDELRSLASELQSKVQNLRDAEADNKRLQDEVLMTKEENKSLGELNVSSAITIKDLQNEVSSLRETKGKLEEEVELRVDQRNALQQEIYCLKEELNELNNQNMSIVEQVHAVGLNPECLGTSVKELQDENSSLRETCQREKSEMVTLLIKLEILEELLEKNSILENSLSDLNAELEAVRGKIKALEEFCQSLLEEKSLLLDEKATLKTQLDVANENLEKLSEKNTFLENSLSDAHDELQGMKTKSRSLEDSFQLLINQNAGLANEKDSLTSELRSTRARLDNLEKRYAELGERHSALEKEKDSSVCKIQELQDSLDVEKQEHTSFSQMSKSQLASMKNEIILLQEELEWTKSEFDKELDKAFESQTESFIFERCAQDLQEWNFCLITEYQNLLETSSSLENMILELSQNNLNQKVEMKSVFDQATALRMGIFQLLKTLDIAVDPECENTGEEDHNYLYLIWNKLGEIKASFSETDEENQQLHIEVYVLVTLLQQLMSELENLEVKKSILDQEFRIRSEQLLELQNEILKFWELNEELGSKVTQGDHTRAVLMAQVSDLHRNSLDLQLSCQDLQKENIKLVEEKGNLTKEISLLESKNHTLEEDNSLLCGEVLSSGFLYLLFRNCVNEKSLELIELAEDLENLNGANNIIRQKLNLTEGMLEDMLIQKEMELQQLREEHKTMKIQVENSHSELQMLTNEIKMWETQASEFYCELQTYNLYQILYEQKVHELSEACEIFKRGSTSKDNDVKLLKERVHILTNQNEGLSAQLAGYGPPVTSLRESISSLEKCISLHGKLKKPENGNVEDAEVSNNVRGRKKGGNEDARVPDPLSELQDLQRRIQCIEMTVTQVKHLMVHENLNVRSELEAAIKQIAELKSESSLHRRHSKPTSEVSEMDNGLLTKDIMLDQISESSSYGISRGDKPILESWETADKDGNIDLTVSKADKMINPSTEKNAKIHRVKSVKQKSQHPASDALVEKELGVDRLEISKRSTEPLQEGNKRKVLERLNSDVQKLANLQITVLDLKKKLEIIEKSKKGKSIDECDILKEQLEEADAAILKLFDLNGKLMKNIEGSPVSSYSKSSMESEESGSVRRRKISGQARRASEKIGRLQLEVQKVQFVLLKLDGEDESKGKSRILEINRRVLLRDYLYGGGVRPNQRRKKAHFCACVQPRTEGE